MRILLKPVSWIARMLEQRFGTAPAGLVSWVVICAAVGALLSTAAWFLGPAPAFRSTATVMILPPAVPEGLVDVGLVPVDMKDRVRVLKTILFGRSRLQQIIDNQKLYTPLQAKMPMADVVEEMQENLSLELEGTNKIVVSVTYSSGTTGLARLRVLTDDRITAQRIVDELVFRLISEHDVIQAKAALEVQQYWEDRREAIAEEWTKLDAELQKMRLSDPRYARVELDRNMARERYVEAQQRLDRAEDYRVLVDRKQAERLELVNYATLEPGFWGTLGPRARNAALAGAAGGLLVWLLFWLRRKSRNTHAALLADAAEAGELSEEQDDEAPQDAHRVG